MQPQRAYPHDAASPAADPRRQSQRLPVTFTCKLRVGTGPWKPACLLNLSEHGFRIGWLPHCAIGRRLWIQLPGLEAVPAIVRWKDNAGAGCEFERQLSPIILEHLVRRA